MGVNCTQQEGDGRYIVPADVMVIPVPCIRRWDKTTIHVPTTNFTATYQESKL